MNKRKKGKRRKEGKEIKNWRTTKKIEERFKRIISTFGMKSALLYRQMALPIKME